jgi:hypothetical protein
LTLSQKDFRWLSSAKISFFVYFSIYFGIFFDFSI